MSSFVNIAKSGFQSKNAKRAGDVASIIMKSALSNKIAIELGGRKKLRVGISGEGFSYDSFAFAVDIASNQGAQIAILFFNGNDSLKTCLFADICPKTGEFHGLSMNKTILTRNADDGSSFINLSNVEPLHGCIFDKNDIEQNESKVMKLMLEDADELIKIASKYIDPANKTKERSVAFN